MPTWCVGGGGGGKKTHPCNSRYRGKIFLFIDQSHRIFAISLRAQRALHQHGHAHATHSWVCLMMRLKSFHPEVDKSWQVTERMPKIKKVSNK
jgi:hypothetical protein